MKKLKDMLALSLVKGRNLIFLATLIVFSSCENQEALDWLTSLNSETELPAPEGTINFEFEILDLTGDPGFILNTFQNSGSIDLYTIFLDAYSPESGTTAQIREMSGDRTGRVVFRITKPGSGTTNSIVFSVNSVTKEISFQMTYESNIYTGNMSITNVLVINRTLYVNSTLSSGSTAVDSDGDGIADDADNCPTTANANQADSDGDGVGDVCDNCPLMVNTNQADADGDGVGDACDCPPGYEGDGVTCVDINECTNGTANCSEDATCSNLDGSYMCTCKVGFEGDGVNCVDVNECTNGTAECGPGTTCVNTYGGYICMVVDTDNDGVLDNVDNCVSDYNPTQADTDGDGTGDECDVCQGNDSMGDGDNDGYCADIDCNDDNLNINPSAVDVAGSGVDANCDGQYVWFVDGDGDGYGSTITVSSSHVSPGIGESSTGDDCDDNNVSINPDTDDVAGSSIDSNCDGQFLWFVDNDGDGHGSESTVSSTNSEPGEGESPVSDDCNDEDADVYPGAPALPDGKDNNCDGLVDKVSQTITFGPLDDVSINDDPIVLGAISSSGLSIQYSSSNQNVAMILGNELTIVGAGETNITASQSGNDGYSAAVPIVQKLVVNKLAQSIDFDPINDHTIGDEPFSITATSSSGLPVSFTHTGNNIQINGEIVTLTNPGRVSIAAGQPGNTTYRAAEEVTQSFCIDPAKPKISVAGRNTGSPTLTSSSVVGNQWYRNETLIEGETESVFVVKKEGVYSVKVQVDDCVSESSDVQVFVITSDDSELLQQEVVVYPNPVTDRLYINLRGFESSKKVKIEIYDLTGKQLDRKNAHGHDLIEMNVSDYLKGEYLLFVNWEKQKVTRRFAKQ